MSVVLKMKHPFEFGDRTISEIEFKPLKGKHMRKLSARPDMNEIMDMASKSAAEPPALFDEMFAPDVIAVAEVIGDFLGGIRPTGDNS